MNGPRQTRVVLTLARPAPREVDRRAHYVAALAAAGARVIAVFPGEPLPDELDALCLSGGGDIHPSRYGEEIAGSEGIDVERDASEFAALDAALRRRAPVLGICRGFQVLNVFLGGTLSQHVEGHHAKHGPVVDHVVEVFPRSILESACSRGPLRVNSWHHQGVRPRDLARGLLPTAAVSAPGTGDLVEAFEAPHLGWVVGVQWHPERAHEVDLAATRIFDAFVAAAADAR